MVMREVDYVDEQGRRWRVSLPEGVSDAQAALGFAIGPPPICDTLKLCEPFATRLHNELHRRELWRLQDIRMRQGELQAAFMAALRLDTQTVEAEYQRLEQSEEVRA